MHLLRKRQPCCRNLVKKWHWPNVPVTCRIVTLINVIAFSIFQIISNKAPDYLYPQSHKLLEETLSLVTKTVESTTLHWQLKLALHRHIHVCTCSYLCNFSIHFINVHLLCQCKCYSTRISLLWMLLNTYVCPVY